MSVTAHLRHGLVCCFLSMGILSGSADGPVRPARPENDQHGRPGGKERKMMAEMINALANCNPPPELVRDSIGKVPLYSADYDG